MSGSGHHRYMFQVVHVA